MNTTTTSSKYGRGIIAPIGLQNSSWKNSEEYLQYIFDTRSDFSPFNYVYLDMSAQTGSYSMYYLNNVNSKSVQKLNSNDNKKFIYSFSNSDLERPFSKITEGRRTFESMIDEFAIRGDKDKLVNSLINELLQSENQYYPDENLRFFLNQSEENIVKGISQINANYSTYWENALSRTSTLILVDYEDNVEYYEYNLTNWTPSGNSIVSKVWKMNQLKFKLNSQYKNAAKKCKTFYFSMLILLICKFII